MILTQVYWDPMLITWVVVLRTIAKMGRAAKSEKALFTAPIPDIFC